MQFSISKKNKIFYEYSKKNKNNIEIKRIPYEYEYKKSEIKYVFIDGGVLLFTNRANR